jgi:Sec-independent protein secretion pathway component TatC
MMAYRCGILFAFISSAFISPGPLPLSHQINLALLLAVPLSVSVFSRTVSDMHGQSEKQVG